MQGSRLCFMCPSNTTNLEDGSSSCPTSVLPGTNMTARYAVIVSFGVYLNGTSLEDIAHKVGRVPLTHYPGLPLLACEKAYPADSVSVQYSHGSGVASALSQHRYQPSCCSKLQPF